MPPDSAIPSVFVCDVRPFDRAALVASLTSQQVPVVRATANIADVVDDFPAYEYPVVLIGWRVIRETAAAAVDALHSANPRACVLLIGVEEATLPIRARDAHADGYLCRNAEFVAQLRRSFPIIAS